MPCCLAAPATVSKVVRKLRAAGFKITATDETVITKDTQGHEVYRALSKGPDGPWIVCTTDSECVTWAQPIMN